MVDIVRFVPPDPASSDSVDVDLYRDVVGRFATGVLVATTRTADVDHVMTVNAFTSVSLDPLLVLICTEKIARFRAAVLDAGTWAVSVLDTGARAASRRFAHRGRTLDGQLGGLAHHPGTQTGLPVLDDAIGVLECATYAVYDGGDHDIVVGRVLGVDTPNPDGTPLIYHRGAYRTLHE